MNPKEIRKELESLETTWKSISDRLTDYQVNSHFLVSSKIAEIQLEYFRKLDLLLKEISVSEMRRSEQQETRILLAEYTVDNAVYSLKFAEYEMLASIYSQKKI